MTMMLDEGKLEQSRAYSWEANRRGEHLLISRNISEPSSPQSLLGPFIYTLRK